MQRAVIAGVRPTRLELIRLSRRELIARKGRDILQEKLDALVIEHTRLSKEMENMAVSIQNQLRDAYTALELAGIMTGWVQLEELAAACVKIPEPVISSSQVMGVTVPDISLPDLPDGNRFRSQRGYSMSGTSAQVDEAALRYESVLESILAYASLEGRADRISREMNRTRRRVNALEHLVIPRLVRTMRYIEFRLEEREREDLFRRKRMKQNMERKERGDNTNGNLL
ncbi:MAG TPA: V-type ATP synthase subunit D [Methanospirillum sp.]|uniref:V-type ATP synthase subunit D n=1 Tax=Methanospirillum sp. TaxID=45200 RepID=UPI002C4B12B5|nr:V-type ATP synthase subunit D [Methanospirillum sp.]HOJ97453.1 V-type ATP synthase subunit D [Methanospirillum sp.]HPP79058.1 V-type ATP synthase subunit D [Methanospirillum sp.]